MKIIAITTPKVINEDTFLIKNLLERGIDFVHLRKPDADINECRKLLAQLTQEERSKIIIHDFSELYVEFSLKGIHVNRNVTSLPHGYNGYKTRSCHSLEEIIKYKNGKGTDSPWHVNTMSLPPAERAKQRSKTFPGIAKAMAEQWG